MPDTIDIRITDGLPIAPSTNKPVELSDDECIMRLADAIDSRDDAKLGDVAALIGRLVVTIE